MAYSKLAVSLKLATELQSSSLGLTIEEMMERTERSRKTVERMLNGLYELGLKPKTSSLEGDHHLTKRWRLDGLPSALLSLNLKELSLRVSGDVRLTGVKGPVSTGDLCLPRYTC